MATAVLSPNVSRVPPKLAGRVQLQKVADRMQVIRRFVESRAVLDVGCVDSRPAREGTRSRIERKPDLLYQQILQLNPDTLGLDIDEAGIRMLVERGHQAVCANVETMDLGRRFDTIVAGEIIEHLENPGRFLRNMHRHLQPGGVLILSTPNPFYAAQAWKIWRHGRPSVHEDHTCWFDPVTLGQLLQRTGFIVSEGYWVQPPGRSIKTWGHLLRSYFSKSFMLLAQPA